jgi:hypothetical protein
MLHAAYTAYNFFEKLLTFIKNEFVRYRYRHLYRHVFAYYLFKGNQTCKNFALFSVTVKPGQDTEV